MKKAQIKPDELLKDSEELIELLNSLNEINIDNFNENDLIKKSKEIEKKIEKKYSKYLPKEDLDTKE